MQRERGNLKGFPRSCFLTENMIKLIGLSCVEPYFRDVSSERKGEE